jgi:hypothetical protein
MVGMTRVSHINQRCKGPVSALRVRLASGIGNNIDQLTSPPTKRPIARRTVAQPGLERYLGVVEVASSNLVGPTNGGPCQH